MAAEAENTRDKQTGILIQPFMGQHLIADCDSQADESTRTLSYDEPATALVSWQRFPQATAKSASLPFRNRWDSETFRRPEQASASASVPVSHRDMPPLPSGHSGLNTRFPAVIARRRSAYRDGDSPTFRSANYAAGKRFVFSSTA
jgi:hypothetical protein